MGGVDREQRVAPMHSPVSWALLGLIIERPSYAYALAQRFERTYGHALPLSSVSHAYAALATLKRQGLVEELPGTKTGPQPKPHWRATAKGMEDYHAWLIGQVAEERRRQSVFLLQLTALTRDLNKAVEILDAYERACLNENSTTPIPAGQDGSADDALELQARLIAEEKRLAIGAKIAWARFARSEIKALSTGARPGSPSVRRAAASGEEVPDR